MTKVALLGDRHHGARGDNLAVTNHQRRFYQNVFFPTLEARGIKDVIQVGDTFDRRKYINFNTLYEARKMYFDPLRERGIVEVNIVGNHDTFSKTHNKINSPDLLLGEYDNILNISEPQEITAAGKKILFVPWINASNYEKSMQMIKETDAKICIGHFEIDGFEMHAGFPNEGGLSQGLFSKFDITISGHFHLRSYKKNIVYIGTPYDMAWEDYGQDKGFHIFDLETLELEFIRNPYSLFRKINYTDSLDIESLNKEDYLDCYVKVIVKEKQDIKHFNKVLDKLSKFELSDLDVLDIEVEYEESTEGSEILEKSTLDILMGHVDLSTTQKNKPRLKSLLQELYVQSINKEE